MKYIIYVLLLLSISCSSVTYDDEINELLCELDAEIKNKDRYVKEKEDKLAKLSANKREVRSMEELYWVNKMLYDEYFYYNSDSTFALIDDNIDISRKLNNREWQVEWQIKKLSLLSSTGMLSNAQEQLKLIDTKNLSRPLKMEYYMVIVDLYSHLLQYMGDEEKNNDFYSKQKNIYQDSAMAIILPSDPSYLWMKGWSYYGKKDNEIIKNELKVNISANKNASREKAMNAYLLAHLYNKDVDSHTFLKYMIISSINDVKIANRDIGSLEELSMLLLEMGDVDRAYNYINYSIQQTLQFKNRVRVVGASKTQDTIRRVYQDRNTKQEMYLRIFLGIVSLLTIILIMSIIYIRRQMKNLSRSRKQLDEANLSLNKKVEQLRDAHCELTAVNAKLNNLNEELQNSNSKLLKLNYSKEEYLGYVFSICSDYISKLDEFRKNVNRKLKVRQFDDLKDLTDTSLMTQHELKDFYNNFDAIFLHVYPDFVSDFNKLLRSDEQIILKEGELLNTELRIYALVRLGITDSVKIAKFLHCSPQTVYNNRMKTRNKSIIAKDEFAATVMSLGKVFIQD